MELRSDSSILSLKRLVRRNLLSLVRIRPLIFFSLKWVTPSTLTSLITGPPAVLLLEHLAVEKEDASIIAAVTAIINVFIVFACMLAKWPVCCQQQLKPGSFIDLTAAEGS
jgi:hypothetical protein